MAVKNPTKWTHDSKNPTQWSKQGKNSTSWRGNVVTVGNLPLVANTLLPLVTNALLGIVTTPSYVVPKNKTVWTASGA